VYDDFPTSEAGFLVRTCAQCVRHGRYSSWKQQRGKIIMAMNQSSSDEPRPAAIEKKPYEKPGFRYEQVFVTSALSCGKINPTDLNCASNPKVS
jgi:hypothetical protein